MQFVYIAVEKGYLVQINIMNKIDDIIKFYHDVLVNNDVNVMMMGAFLIYVVCFVHYFLVLDFAVEDAVIVVMARIGKGKVMVMGKIDVFGGK